MANPRPKNTYQLMQPADKVIRLEIGITATGASSLVERHIADEKLYNWVCGSICFPLEEFEFGLYKDEIRAVDILERTIHQYHHQNTPRSEQSAEEWR